MDNQSAAAIVEGICASLQHDPGQFHLAINVTGQAISVQGGTGLVISAQGGGPGSTTVGQQLTLDGGRVEIARQAGLQAMDAQMEALITSLGKVAAELRSPTPRKSVVERLVSSLTGTWVPGVITSVLGNLLTMAAF